MGIVGFEYFCSKQEIITQIYQALLADITSDGNLPIILVRFLHNKPLYSLILIFRCYLHFFDPFIISAISSPFLLPLIYYGYIRLIKNKIFLILVLLFPFIDILIINNVISDKYLVPRIYFISIAILGLLFFFRRKPRLEE